jgi:hypothetical protein
MVASAAAVSIQTVALTVVFVAGIPEQFFESLPIRFESCPVCSCTPSQFNAVLTENGKRQLKAC